MTTDPELLATIGILAAGAFVMVMWVVEWLRAGRAE